MAPDEIAAYLMDTFDGLAPIDAWGETSFFYNPGHVLKRGVYFATIKSKNGDNDRASDLDRDGVFRLNIGTPPVVYEDLFGPRPSRPTKGKAVRLSGANPINFGELNKIMPHPVYAWMGWICVLNPRGEIWNLCTPLLQAAYEKSVTSFAKRKI